MSDPGGILDLPVSASHALEFLERQWSTLCCGMNTLIDNGRLDLDLQSIDVKAYSP